MTSEKELYELIERAQSVGAIVTVTHDGNKDARDPRGFIQSIQVSNLDGIGPHPMSPLHAAERLREALREPFGWLIAGTSHPDMEADRSVKHS
ncbi:MULTISPECIES: hypothetical protein [Burkholderia]|jgi:hypothetical protein|uniref:Uncharacterized protein n=1 Tax=Burkholderia contaminans TaxID=488447 RepID=A0A1E3FNI3_9BURK|nr:hypothetical protein [Burkholderia contaminans]ELK7724892.1 hypothetical protein [Burkholderia cenocepacia]UTP27884.1 hypothetical protein NMB33_40315 [Burkholderia sp. FXe9]HBN6128837.1 hypothetical protein [Clostridioides difficile]MBA9833398.1 hypothetical protein [Burkholderia contaminans]MBH9693769.1 hypothetical protein [Burkholderia contaminans]